MNLHTGHLRQGVRRRLSSWIAPDDSAARARAQFYPQQASCQIPDLSSLYSRFLGERMRGSFVEVGAYDGKFVSNTWGLAARGWQGWMVEPVPHLAARCRRNHAEHPSVQVIERAIGPQGITEVRLFVAGTLTTANPEAFKEYESVDWASGVLTDKEIVVPCQTLDAFFAEAEVPEDLDVVVVDVEGFETEVFSAFSIDDWRPKMLIIELADTHPDLALTSARDALLGRRLQESGYKIVFKDRVNTVLVRDDIWCRAYGL